MRRMTVATLTLAVVLVAGRGPADDGDPDVTVSGRHAYTLRYPLEGLLQQGAFAWNAVGTGWDVPVGPVEVHVTAPNEFVDVACMQGAEGPHRPCTGGRQDEPGHVTFTLDGLEPNEGVTVVGELGTALAEPPEAPQPPG